MALLIPVSHDEDQYVAAAALAGRGLRPFADFIYLQTPLQLALTGPVAAATPGWGFIALRLANAALGLAALAFVFAAQRCWGVDRRTALWMSVLMATCVPFAFGAGVARNDALPATLLAVALWLTAGKGGLPPLRLALAALALGLAASAKISFALPLAAGGLWLLWRAAKGGSWHRVLAWSLGGATGMLPCVMVYVAAPDAFRYGVFDFAREAGFDWYRLNGLEQRLTLTGKLGDGVWALAQGPALAALVLLAFATRVVPAQAGTQAVPASELEDAQGSRLRGNETRGLVRALLIGGLIGAFLPTPTYKQYFIAALPPLFVALGMAAHGLRRPGRWLLNGFALLATAGLVIAGVRDWRRDGAPAALAVTASAHDIGRRMRAAGAIGPIATVSAARALDSGVALDSRFAAGASGFRSADLRTPAELARWHIASPATLAAVFAAEPPGAILTGYEGPSAVNIRRFPDAPLDAWATAHGWQAQPLADGRGVLWLPPRSGH